MRCMKNSVQLRIKKSDSSVLVPETPPMKWPFFKETYTIPFPLFSDGDFAIHKTIGERGTPFFIALVPGAPKGRQIFFTHAGDMGDLDLFLKRLITPKH